MTIIADDEERRHLRANRDPLQDEHEVTGR